MFQPAIDAGETITPCAIRYELADGVVENEICWWGNMPLGPHLLNFLGKREISASITFGDPVPAVGDRKTLGLELRSRVVALYEQMRHQPL
jgi:hypothetical protein